MKLPIVRAKINHLQIQRLEVDLKLNCRFFFSTLGTNGLILVDTFQNVYTFHYANCEKVESATYCSDLDGKWGSVCTFIYFYFIFGTVFKLHLSDCGSNKHLD